MSRMEGMAKKPSYKNKITVILTDLDDGGVDIAIKGETPFDLAAPETNAEKAALIFLGSLQDQGRIELDRLETADGKVVQRGEG